MKLYAQEFESVIAIILIEGKIITGTWHSRAALKRSYTTGKMRKALVEKNNWDPYLTGSCV